MSLKNQLAAALSVTFVLSLHATAQAENDYDSPKTSTSTTTITTTNTEGMAGTPTPTPDPIKEFLVSKTFGSKGQSGTTGCKTEELSDKKTEELEATCNTWIKTQKLHLKGKFQTGTCDESCDDCGMSLKRCSVTAVVHYSK